MRAITAKACKDTRENQTAHLKMLDNTVKQRVASAIDAAAHRGEDEVDVSRAGYTFYMNEKGCKEEDEVNQFTLVEGKVVTTGNCKPVFDRYNALIRSTVEDYRDRGFGVRNQTIITWK